MARAPRELRRHIVVFLDLLGFRDRMLLAANAKDSGLGLLREYDDVMAEALAAFDTSDGFYQLKGFTDNFLISTPLSSGHHPEARFGHLLEDVAEFQARLATRGWFVRGGIAVGPFFMDEQLVFGPALVESYQLEQWVALDPRIVLSREAKNWLRSFLEFYAEKQGPQSDRVLIDVDGNAFINYLWPQWGWDDPLATLEIAQAHKERVEQALTASSATPRVWSKYRWVAGYHDFFVGRYFPEHADDLRVSPGLLRRVPTELSSEVLPADFKIPWGSGRDIE